jgi:hypothetical protein
MEHGTTRLPLDGFSWNLMSVDFSKIYLTGITCTWHVDQYTFSSISRSVIVRMKIVSDKSYRENQDTHFVFNNNFFFQNRAVYEITWKNTLEQGRPQMKIWRMRIACGIPKDKKNTLRMYNAYCSSSVTMASRTRLNVTLYVSLLVSFVLVPGKVKIKFTLEQAMKAQRRSRPIAVLFL